MFIIPTSLSLHDYKNRTRVGIFLNIIFENEKDFKHRHLFCSMTLKEKVYFFLISLLILYIIFYGAVAQRTTVLGIAGLIPTPAIV